MKQIEVDPVATIAAIATAAGSAALAMVRLSGPRAISVADELSGGAAGRMEAGVLRHCRLRDDEGRTIDDGMLAVFRAPRSFTGEDSVEFTGHGGLLVVGEVLAAFLRAGAVAAGPGEFTQRAFLNGKLDLTQAEGIIDVISARTRLALRAARGQLDGKLGQRTLAARDHLLETLAHLEAWIDFPEEDISPASREVLVERLGEVRRVVISLLGTADQGRVLREGARTVICGEPNVGKSSLMNHLLGFSRAIVNEKAGTTRDTIEEVINLDGLPLRLVDTAGLREAGDEIEAEGIARSLRQIADADLLLEVVDASRPKSSPAAFSEALAARVRVLNKCDLGIHGDWAEDDGVRVSCVSGDGLDGLAAAVRGRLHFDEMDFGEELVVINARHQLSLEAARVALDAALEGLSDGGSDPELAAIDLREALDALGEITGKVDTEDLLGVIFSRFCIGK